MSSAATASLLKPVFLSEAFLTSSTPPTTLSFPFLPSKRFVIPTLTSAKLLKSASRLKLVSFVAAQTSDWMQEEKEEDAVEDVSEGVEEVIEEGEVGFSEPPEEAKLFVGNLPFDFDSEELANLFNQSGVVEIAEVIYNRETDMSRRFGFVTMSTVEEAEKLWRSLVDM